MNRTYSVQDYTPRIGFTLAAGFSTRRLFCVCALTSSLSSPDQSDNARRYLTRAVRYLTILPLRLCRLESMA